MRHKWQYKSKRCLLTMTNNDGVREISVYAPEHRAIYRVMATKHGLTDTIYIGTEHERAIELFNRMALEIRDDFMIVSMLKDDVLVLSKDNVVASGGGGVGAPMRGQKVKTSGGDSGTVMIAHDDGNSTVRLVDGRVALYRNSDLKVLEDWPHAWPCDIVYGMVVRTPSGDEGVVNKVDGQGDVGVTLACGIRWFKYQALSVARHKFVVGDLVIHMDGTRGKVVCLDPTFEQYIVDFGENYRLSCLPSRLEFQSENYDFARPSAPVVYGKGISWTSSAKKAIESMAQVAGTLVEQQRVMDRLFRFFAGLDLCDQPLDVQKEAIEIVHEYVKVVGRPR